MCYDFFLKYASKPAKKRYGSWPNNTSMRVSSDAEA